MDRQRLAELFDQAIEIPPAELARWFAENCGDDLMLRQHLEHLLRADAKAQRFMETPPREIGAAAASALSASADPPQSFGVYRVLHSIGIGGMGQVWLAERGDGEFDQRVAIKQLAYPTPGLLQRFRQERQILARLEHANIARLLDGGVESTGVPYLVMEYVEGAPITDYVRERMLDLRARLELFLRVCDGVQYAHQNLVVHRDLKPSNIFVNTDGVPKLLDFGIAKVLATTDAATTQTAARQLTPDYAAPEQFEGGAITTATDVYALGVVLYELLAEMRPPRRQFAAGSDSASEPEPPSAALNRSAHNATRRRALRGDLDRIVLTALAYEQQRRYSSAEALASDIRRYLSGHPIAARGDSAWYRLRKYARRNRYSLAAATIAFAVCLAATIVSVHQATIARDEAQRAGSVRQFLVGVLRLANPDESGGKPISAHRLLEKGEQQIQQRLGSQPALEADVAALLGQLYSELGDLRHGEVLLRHALAVSATAGVPDDVRARVFVNIAVQESQNEAQFDASSAHAREALVLLQENPRKNAEEIAKAHWIVASNTLQRGDQRGAATLLRSTIPQDRAILGDNNELVAKEWMVLGDAMVGLREEGAKRMFENALAIMRNVYGENSIHVAQVLEALDAVYVDASDFANSEDVHRKILQVYVDTLGADHPETLTARSNLLDVIENEGRYEEALPQRKQLLEQTMSSSETNPVTLASRYESLGNNLRILGRYDEAEAMEQKTLELIEHTEGPRSPSSVVALSHLATTLMLQGHLVEAETALRESLAREPDQTSRRACGIREYIGLVMRFEHRYVEAIAELQELFKEPCNVTANADNHTYPMYLSTLSETQLDSGDLVGASVSAETAVRTARKVFSHPIGMLARPLLALGRVKLALHRPEEAEQLLREALSLRSPGYPADHLRTLEVEVPLAIALAAQNKTAEAQMLAAKIAPFLKASSSPYAAELLARLLAK